MIRNRYCRNSSISRQPQFFFCFSNTFFSNTALFTAMQAHQKNRKPRSRLEPPVKSMQYAQMNLFNEADPDAEESEMEDINLQNMA